MSVFEINGGKKLRGDVTPQGAKNEALQIICAVLLTDDLVTIHNIPDIRDVNNLIDLLECMGVEVTRISRSICQFKAHNIDLDYLTSDEYKIKGAALRGSVMVLGPLLSRYRKAYQAL